MSLDNELHWRETYFIFFDSSRRPTLEQAKKAVGHLSDKYEIKQIVGDDSGRLETLSLSSPDDNAALEISYESGDAVVEQTTELAKQLKSEAEPEDLAKLVKADARFDVMHFELMHDEFYAGEDSDDGGDEFGETLDPSCLLLVVQALVKLTRGIPVDPASGTILP